MATDAMAGADSCFGYMRALHFIGLMAVAVIYGTAIFFVFLFRGKLAFGIVDDFLMKHDLADIEPPSGV